ncbi:hypothetical protein T492DRAFT_1116801, partial [Pavlovales sp. CCMP2436]
LSIYLDLSFSFLFFSSFSLSDDAIRVLGSVPRLPVCCCCTTGRMGDRLRGRRFLYIFTRTIRQNHLIGNNNISSHHGHPNRLRLGAARVAPLPAAPRGARLQPARIRAALALRQPGRGRGLPRHGRHHAQRLHAACARGGDRGAHLHAAAHGGAHVGSDGHPSLGRPLGAQGGLRRAARAGRRLAAGEARGGGVGARLRRAALGGRAQPLRELRRAARERHDPAARGLSRRGGRRRRLGRARALCERRRRALRLRPRQRGPAAVALRLEPPGAHRLGHADPSRRAAAPPAGRRWRARARGGAAERAHAQHHRRGGGGARAPPDRQRRRRAVGARAADGAAALRLVGRGAPVAGRDAGRRAAAHLVQLALARRPRRARRRRVARPRQRGPGLGRAAKRRARPARARVARFTEQCGPQALRVPAAKRRAIRQPVGCRRAAAGQRRAALPLPRAGLAVRQRLGALAPRRVARPRRLRSALRGQARLTRRHARQLAARARPRPGRAGRQRRALVRRLGAAARLHRPRRVDATVRRPPLRARAPAQRLAHARRLCEHGADAAGGRRPLHARRPARVRPSARAHPGRLWRPAPELRSWAALCLADLRPLAGARARAQRAQRRPVRLVPGLAPECARGGGRRGWLRARLVAARGGADAVLLGAACGRVLHARAGGRAHPERAAHVRNHQRGARDLAARRRRGARGRAPRDVPLVGVRGQRSRVARGVPTAAVHGQAGGRRLRLDARR